MMGGCRAPCEAPWPRVIAIKPTSVGAIIKVVEPKALQYVEPARSLLARRTAEDR